MSTGDIKGNIAQLQRCLQHLKYPSAVDEIGLTLGDPLATLPILNFVLLKYSRHVAAYVLSRGIQLQGKTDEGFVKHAFRLFRDHLGLRVIITPAQFLEQGFAERKVLLLVDVVKAARQLHQAGSKQERLKLDNACRQSPAKLSQAPKSPVTPSVQLNAGQPVPQRLHQVPVTAATDAAEKLFEVISPEKPDLTAAAITILTSPTQRKPPHQHFTARQSSPKAAAQGAGNVSSNKHGSPHRWPGSTSQQQQLLQAHHDSRLPEVSLLQPRAVLPQPAKQPQRLHQVQQQYGGPNSNKQDQLIAAGLAPLPRGVVAQQQEQQHHRRPLKACLWPLHGQNAEGGTHVAAAEDISGHDMLQANSNSNRQHQQQQDEELLGTTTFMPAPQHHNVIAANDGLESAHGAPLQEVQRHLVESQAVIADLQERLTQAEQQLQEHRSAAAGFQESASARITLLEGRLKFLENLINSSRQQGPSAARGQDSGNRSRTSVPAAAVMDTHSSRRYMPATHHTERYSPVRSAAAADAAAVSGMDWRSAASAAAAAVVAGLTASPLKSPLRSKLKGPDRGSAGRLHAWSTDDLLAERNSWQGTTPKLSDTDTLTAGDTSPQDNYHREQQRQQQQQGCLSGSSAATEHTVPGKASARMAVEAADIVRSSCSRPGKAKGSIPGATRGGSTGYPDACSKSISGREKSDTGTLIDKLASRAVEAAAMLEAFRAGNMA